MSSMLASFLSSRRFPKSTSIRHINATQGIQQLYPRGTARLSSRHRSRVFGKAPCPGAGFECDLGREGCFPFILTHSFLHQPYVIYSIFITNTVMKPHFVQLEAVMRERGWFGKGRRWRVRCKTLFLLQVRKAQFKVDPGCRQVRQVLLEGRVLRA